jgi:hypothetical protein
MILVLTGFPPSTDATLCPHYIFIAILCLAHGYFRDANPVEEQVWAALLQDYFLGSVKEASVRVQKAMKRPDKHGLHLLCLLTMLWPLLLVVLK